MAPATGNRATQSQPTGVVPVSSEGQHRPRLLALDTGGTMTDTFVVDDDANYTVGKAQTTPDDESVCTRHSFGDALENWGVPAQAGALGGPSHRGRPANHCPLRGRSATASTSTPEGVRF